MSLPTEITQLFKALRPAFTASRYQKCLYYYSSGPCLRERATNGKGRVAGEPVNFMARRHHVL